MTPAEELELEQMERFQANARRAHYVWSNLCHTLDLRQRLFLNWDTGRIVMLPDDKDSWEIYNLLMDFWTEAA